MEMMEEDCHYYLARVLPVLNRKYISPVFHLHSVILFYYIPNDNFFALHKLHYVNFNFLGKKARNASFFKTKYYYNASLTYILFLLYNFLKTIHYNYGLYNCFLFFCYNI